MAYNGGHYVLGIGTLLLDMWTESTSIQEDTILSVATEGVDKGPIRRPNGDHILGHNGPL